MTDIKDLTKIKELIEILVDKVERVELMQRVTTDQVRIMKDQLSVVNKKLDQLPEIQETLDTLKSSVVQIETKISVYEDMYKINQDYIQRLNTRLVAVEAKNKIDAPENLLVPSFE